MPTVRTPRMPRIQIVAIVFALGIALLSQVDHPFKVTLTHWLSLPLVAGIFKYGWAAIISFILIRNMYYGGFVESVGVLKSITFETIFQSVLLIACVGLTIYGLYWVPILRFSWLYLIPGHSGPASNLILIPATIKFFGPIFLLILVFNLPLMARNEELMFRDGTLGWRDGCIRSVKFGLVHCLVGVPICAGLALILSGLWFTKQYFAGGVDRSTLYHTTYNLIWVVIILSVLLYNMVHHTSL